MTAASDRLLLYVPVPVHRHEGRIWIEDQAIIGLHRWSENFGHVDVMMPMQEIAPPAGWSPSTPVDALDNISLHLLPTAYRPDRFFRQLPRTRRRIAALIAQADYLSFSIGGLFGDWGAVSGFAAHRMGRRFAIWTDRVESEVTRRAIHTGPLKSRLRARLYHRPMAALERAVIRRATVGLFHGRETFDHYSPHARQSEIVHDILVSRADHIAPDRLAAKRAEARSGPLRLLYVGRADAMKGPLDWLDVLRGLRARGVDFRATWLGTGTEHAEMVQTVAREGLSEVVDLPGFVTDRARVLGEMRRAHVFLFCHKTPESPRCLIEALFSGTPLVGYDGAFARDLIRDDRGGVLRPIGDVEGLVEAVAGLDADRARLAGLIGAAFDCGRPFDDETVFRHRSEIIRRYLGPQT